MTPSPAKLARGAQVFVDTNVIFEAHRSNCWSGLIGYYQIHTVEKCIEECGTGNDGKHAVTLDLSALRTRATICQVPQDRLVHLAIQLHGIALDDGEAELLAYVCKQPGAWLLCSPDKAAIRAAASLGMLDRVVALEEMTATAGLHPDLRKQFQTVWLTSFRTALALESL